VRRGLGDAHQAIPPSGVTPNDPPNTASEHPGEGRLARNSLIFGVGEDHVVVERSLKQELSTPVWRYMDASNAPVDKAYKRLSLQPQRQCRWREFRRALCCLLDEKRPLLATAMIDDAAHYVHLTPASGGFSIYVSKEENGVFLLSFGGWFDEFENATVVVSLIKEALAGRIRTRTEKIKGKIKSTSAEIHTDGDHWISFGEISYFLFNPLARTPVVTYQQFEFS
jgi:hypothetical protein